MVTWAMRHVTFFVTFETLDFAGFSERQSQIIRGNRRRVTFVPRFCSENGYTKKTTPCGCLEYRAEDGPPPDRLLKDKPLNAGLAPRRARGNDQRIPRPVTARRPGGLGSTASAPHIRQRSRSECAGALALNAATAPTVRDETRPGCGQCEGSASDSGGA